MSDVDDTLDVSKLGPRVNLEALKAAVRNIDKASMEEMMAKMRAMAEETKQEGGDKETLTKKLAAELGSKIKATMMARGADELVWKFFVFAIVVAILFCVLGRTATLFVVAKCRGVCSCLPLFYNFNMALMGVILTKANSKWKCWNKKCLGSCQLFVPWGPCIYNFDLTLTSLTLI